MGPAGCEAVPPEPNGRLRSRELGLELALEEGGVRLYTLTGELLLDHVETDSAWREAEAQRAEEARQRQEAEEAWAEEARRRQEAEEARAEEARRRQEAEARLAELERQLAERRAPRE